MGTDFWIVVKWWVTLFLVGAVSFPLTKKLFSSWYDKGYLFAKAVGLASVTYIVYIAAMSHVLPFVTESILMAMIALFLFGIVVNSIKTPESEVTDTEEEYHGVKKLFRSYRSKRSLRFIGIFIVEEVFFFAALLFWSWVKGHEPSIHGLEKFMDFGFMQSILNSRYFPAPDMWYAGYPINYYYFGHTVVAVLTKLSNISLVYTFNLMLATIFALCVTMSFSIGVHILNIGMPKLKLWAVIAGAVLIAFLVSLGGNMQTLYAFTKGYTGENVQPFWQLLWTPQEFMSKLPEGLERYWYANATRFIPYTIHEFPSYSFVVSDVHGHVMSIPFVLLAIALLLSIFLRDTKIKKNDWGIGNGDQNLRYVYYGQLVSILLMTNALDGPIYLGLFLVMFAIVHWKEIRAFSQHWKYMLLTAGMVILAAVAGSVPFMSRFSSFVSGVAFNCPPSFLANIKIGPLLFEGVEKCQHSPFWMMWLLWGFFIYCGVWYINTIFNLKFSIFSKVKKFTANSNITRLDVLFIVFFCISIALIIFPEFFYFKDIYPQHFRSNTMFKLGYQAFIMFSIFAGYVIVYAVHALRMRITINRSRLTKLFLILLIPQLFLVSIYPIFSVRSYFNSLRIYKGLDGAQWLNESYPDDYAGIMWLRSTALELQASNTAPVIVEADGDSYTDHARFSAFTGLPAVIGWPVHEWLWRGTYDVVAPRREEVRVIYESDDDDATTEIIQKYGVQYIIVGGMERAKFADIKFEKLDRLAEVVFSQGELQIYKIRE